MRTRYPLPSLLTLAAMLLGSSLPTAAAADPALRCQTTKLATVGTEARARLTCEQRSLGGNASPSCATDAAVRRDTAFTRSEQSGTCSTVGDAAILGEAVTDLLATVRGQLVPSGPAPSGCTGRQLAATGRAIAQLVVAHLRDARTNDPVRLANALVATRSQLAARFSRAAALGGCLSSVSASAISDVLEQAATTFRGMLLDACPCWTTAQLDAAFPVGFFDANGRGGVVCGSPGTSLSIGAADLCTLAGPLGQVLTLPRGGAAVVPGGFCTLVPDLDPNDTGSCSAPPTVRTIDARQTAACTARLLASFAYHHLCP